MKELNFFGFLTGLFSFIVIGLFHPVVIKLEYHFGKKIWWILFFPGVLLSVISLFFMNDTVSVLLGILGFALIWSARELIEQHKRVMLRGLERKHGKIN